MDVEIERVDIQSDSPSGFSQEMNDLSQSSSEYSERNSTEDKDSDNSPRRSIFPSYGSNSHDVVRKSKSVHANFLLLKKKLNLENFSRKTQIDSLLKKCKSKAFRTIHEALKKCLKIKLPRLPQPFITNIKIDFNKVYLDKTILEIYKECSIIPSVEEYYEKKYIHEDKVNLFKDFLNLTFKNVFEYYLNSIQYVKDYNHIMQREGESFALLFNYISKVFIFYYEKSKGNSKHKKLVIDYKDVPESSEKHARIFDIKKVTCKNSAFVQF